MKISQYAKTSDSKSLAQIDGKSFIITSVEDSNYEEDGKITPGVKITTKESFDVGDQKYNKFHTTRIAIVNKLKQDEVRNDLKAGKTIGPVKCEFTKPQKGGKHFFDLVDVE